MPKLSFDLLTAVYPANAFYVILEEILGKAIQDLVSQGYFSVSPPWSATPNLGERIGQLANFESGSSLFMGIYRGEKTIVSGMPDLYISLHPSTDETALQAIVNNESTLVALCKELTNPEIGLFWGFNTDGQHRLWAVMSLVDVARSPNPEDTAARFYKHTLNSLHTLDLFTLIL